MVIIPLTSDPNQSFNCTIPVDGKNMTLKLKVSFNSSANYWTLTIINSKTNATILESIPMLTGDYPAANLLGQYSYLKIGSAYLINVGNNDLDNPDNTCLGIDFLLAWGDTA